RGARARVGLGRALHRESGRHRARRGRGGRARARRRRARQAAPLAQGGAEHEGRGDRRGMNGETLVVRSARFVPHLVGGVAALVVLALAGAGAPAQAIDEKLLADVAVRAIGPATTGGRIVDVAVPAQAPWRIYAASASGGVWRSDNNGTTWSCIF